MREITLDCSALLTLDGFYDAFAQALPFPSYFGHNLDALYDCLTDVSTPTRLRLLHWQCLEVVSEQFAQTAKRVILEAAGDDPHLTVLFE